MLKNIVNENLAQSETALRMSEMRRPLCMEMNFLQNEQCNQGWTFMLHIR